MSARAYLLLDIVPGKSEDAARSLRNGACAMVVDLIEGSPDIIVMIEASQRQALARLTVRAIASVEAITRDIQLLPVRGVTRRRWQRSPDFASTDGQIVTEGVVGTEGILKKHHKAQAACITQ